MALQREFELFSAETGARIERLAKLTARTPKEVVEAALGLWEQQLLTGMPAARRSGYMARMVEYAVVLPYPPQPLPPRPVKPDSGYRVADEGDSFIVDNDRAW